jgi:hypothetical protein
VARLDRQCVERCGPSQSRDSRDIAGAKLRTGSVRRSWTSKSRRHTPAGSFADLSLPSRHNYFSHRCERCAADAARLATAGVGTGEYVPTRDRVLSGKLLFAHRRRLVELIHQCSTSRWDWGCAIPDNLRGIHRFPVEFLVGVVVCSHRSAA